jgi:hypothetical protein
MIAQANTKVNDKGEFKMNECQSPPDGRLPVVEPKEINLMDVAPNQIASIAASPDPVPGAQRCQPCADGIEHDASGRAAAASGSADRGYRSGGTRARDSRVLLVLKEKVW